MGPSNMFLECGHVLFLIVRGKGRIPMEMMTNIFHARAGP